MQKVDDFILKDGRAVEIIWPNMKYLKALTDFINRLSKEDTYLSFAGETYSLGFEKNWLDNAIREISFGKSCIYWALLDGKIIGAADVRQNLARGKHVGTIGLMVDEEFRNLGLGSHLLGLILDQAQKSGYKTVKLDLFEENEVAKKMYEKYGFIQYGKLPKSLLRQGKYSNEIFMYKDLEDK